MVRCKGRGQAHRHSHHSNQELDTGAAVRRWSKHGLRQAVPVLRQEPFPVPIRDQRWGTALGTEASWRATTNSRRLRFTLSSSVELVSESWSEPHQSSKRTRTTLRPRLLILKRLDGSSSC